LQKKNGSQGGEENSPVAHRYLKFGIHGKRTWQFMDFTEISLDFMEIEWEFRTFPQ
jgi:hypothetical protein